MIFFNVVWQSLKEQKPKEKKKDKSNKTWKVLKLLISISYWIWKILRFFFDDGDAS